MHDANGRNKNQLNQIVALLVERFNCKQRSLKRSSRDKKVSRISINLWRHQATRNLMQSPRIFSVQRKFSTITDEMSKKPAKNLEHLPRRGLEPLSPASFNRFEFQFIRIAGFFTTRTSGTISMSR